MADLSKYSDEELEAMLPPERSGLEDFFSGGHARISSRGLGAIQRIMELTGADEAYPETYTASQRASEKMNRQLEESGGWGMAGDFLADPLNLILPAAKGKGLVDLAKLGFKGGLASGALTGYEEGQSPTQGTATLRCQSASEPLATDARRCSAGTSNVGS